MACGCCSGWVVTVASWGWMWCVREGWHTGGRRSIAGAANAATYCFSACSHTSLDLSTSSSEFINLLLKVWPMAWSAMGHVTRIIWERQLQLFGYIVRLPEAGPSCQVLCAREPTSWRRPKGRVRGSCLQQMEGDCRGLGMGVLCAWGMTHRRPQEYRRAASALASPA